MQVNYILEKKSKTLLISMFININIPKVIRVVVLICFEILHLIITTIPNI